VFDIVLINQKHDQSRCRIPRLLAWHGNMKNNKVYELKRARAHTAPLNEHPGSIRIYAYARAVIAERRARCGCISVSSGCVVVCGVW
jgi:hypothetical protein